MPSSSDPTKPSGTPQLLFDILKNRVMDEQNKYVSQEFQDFGYRLSMELGDEAHKSLYIKMAKTIDRQILEAARTFVIDSNARSKARLFMWKVKELRSDKDKRKNSGSGDK